MAKKCDLTSVGAMFGNKVSKSNRKTRRKFLPNLQNATFKSDVLGINITLKLATKTLRTVNKYGSLDSFLINYGHNKLSTEGRALRSRVKKSLLAKNLYETVKIIKDKKVIVA